MSHRIRFTAHAALIAALYVVLTLISAVLGLSGGVVQLRLAEALCILPAFTASAIPGITIGCLIANMLTGCLPWDIAFGTLATLLGALGCRFIRRAPMGLWPLPTILANTAIIPLVLLEVYGASGAYPVLVVSVGLGEGVSAGLLGILLAHSLKRTGQFRK